MRRSSFIFAFLFVLSLGWLPAVDSQIEFAGELEAIDTSGDPAVLTLRLTPTFSIPVLVTELTEIRDEHGDPIELADLIVGQNLEVEGLFTPDGILALEVKISDNDAEFEVRGFIESIGPDRVIQVNGLTIEVPETAEIKDQEGNLLTFAELEVGQFVKVEGNTVGDALVAREVKVRTPPDDFATVRFRGVISEIIDDNTFIVLLPGEVPVQVVITPETKVKGELAVGVLVRVIGRLRADLAVEARKIMVQRLLQLAPPRLRLHPNQLHRVVVILRSPFDQDVELMVDSQDPDVATPDPMSLNISAGRLTGSFHVLAGNAPGETTITVAMPADLGGLTVELPVKVVARDDEEDEEEGEEELEVKWKPDRISASPSGRRDVRLQLNEPAPSDLVIELTLREGPADQVFFPPEVMIPAGERSTLVPIELLSTQVNARIRATLPADIGGDTDDLEIVAPREVKRLKISWRPDEVETHVGSEFEVRLVLDQPAPEDLTVFLSRKGGDSSGHLEGVPEEVHFEAGQQEVVLAMTAARPGKVRLRASLPLRLGGRHDDLKVEIEDED